MMAQLICPPQAPTTVYSLGEPECQESRLFLATIERQAVGEFQTPLHVLDIYKSSCETNFFFFGSYTHERDEVRKIPTLREATTLISLPNYPSSPAPCRYMWPHTIRTEVDLYRKTTGGVLTIPGGPMRSPAGNMDNCQYWSGLCVLSTGRVTWWTSSRQYRKITEALGQEEIEVFRDFVRSPSHKTDLRILTKNSTEITTEASLTFHLNHPLDWKNWGVREAVDPALQLHWEDVNSRFSYILHSMEGVLQEYNKCSLRKSLQHFDALVSSVTATLWARRNLRNTDPIARKSGSHSSRVPSSIRPAGTSLGHLLPVSSGSL